MRIENNESLSYETKTKSSKRPVRIPEELRQALVDRTRDKLPTALIFQSAVGKMYWTVWVNRAAHRLCRQAGIPGVCAHALRGFAANTAVASGESPQTVARALGHVNPGVTMAHYVKSGTSGAVELERGLKILRGGKKN